MQGDQCGGHLDSESNAAGSTVLHDVLNASNDGGDGNEQAHYAHDVQSDALQEAGLVLGAPHGNGCVERMMHHRVVTNLADVRVPTRSG